MKKLIYLFWILILLVSISSCKKTKKLELNTSQINLFIEETFQIELINDNFDLADLEYSEYDQEIIMINDHIVTGLKAGTTTIKVRVKDNKKVEPFYIDVKVTKKIVKPTEISSVSEINLIVEEQYDLIYQVLPAEAVQEVRFEVGDTDIISIGDGGVITALQVGQTTLKIISTCDETIYKAIIVNVSKRIIKPTEIVAVSQIELLCAETYQLSYQVLPAEAVQEVRFEVEDTDIISISDNGIITALQVGKTTLKIISTYDETIFKTIQIIVTVPDTEKPRLQLQAGAIDKLTINWGKTIDLLADVEAIDNVDGDISNQIIVIESYDPTEYGIQEITYEVSDSAGNKQTLKRNVEIVWNYDVEFIGHAGCYYGIMNTEEAIMYAITKLKYQAVEVDLKQTKDGVFVLSHDDTFGDYTIANTDWAVLKDVEITKSRSAGYPANNGSVTGSPYTSKICSLERYLEICKQYNVKAVIELKSSAGITNSDQSRMQALMDIIEKHEMRNKVIFLGSQYNCLIWTRNNGYSDVECQYLVNSCESETTFNLCIEYNLDISINTTGSYSNSEEWLAKYKEQGIKISTYTYTQWVDYDVVQEWINKGVDYVTCDWHLMSKLVLPESSNEPKEQYTVTFVDYDGTILKETLVEKGKTVAAPNDPTRLGYEFIGWDKSLRNIREDQTITASYEIINYTITYVGNLSSIKEVHWETKSDFINEFYIDLFTWIKDNASNINGLTINNGTYTLTRNSTTATFSSIDELKAIDKYAFEKTISNILYKPLIRNSDGTAKLEIDDNYFLNSSQYLVKYQGMDPYLYNAIKNGYPAYDTTYTPTSAGKIQIWFRFHQWAQGTNISVFNDYPVKYIEEMDSSVSVTMPSTHLTYTINDEFILPIPTGNKTFLGWYLTSDCSGPQVTEIKIGTTGNLTLYAKWS